jgi:nicotinate-nucleotide adenylyltransferase
MNDASKILTSPDQLRAFQGHKLGVLAGSFDPCHLGHLHAAELVLSEGLVETVFFMTFLQQPEGTKRYEAIEHRLFMLNRLAEHSAFTSQIWGIDPRLLSNYFKRDTYETLSSLDRDGDFLIIAGNETYYEGYPDFLKRNTHVVYMRPGHPKRLHREVLQGAYTERPAPSEISSTSIKLDGFQEIERALPPGAEEYIARHGLYATSRTG